MMTDDEILAVVRAHKEGKEIEQQDGINKTWMPFDGTWLFVPYWRYRVKQPCELTVGKLKELLRTIPDDYKVYVANDEVMSAPRELFTFDELRTTTIR